MFDQTEVSSSKVYPEQYYKLVLSYGWSNYSEREILLRGTKFEVCQKYKYNFCLLVFLNLFLK